MNYQKFKERKRLKASSAGFKPVWIPDFLYEFQQILTEWAIRIGRGAIFADCGLGKTPVQLVWAENVLRKTNKRVLILTPLAVAQQTIKEGVKFGIDVKLCRNGKVKGPGIYVCNYQRLHYFDPGDFEAIVLDESSILKNFEGKTRKAITQFVRQIPFRLPCTASPAPNDYMELGTTSEALGVMSHNQMLGMFFSNGGKSTQQWELRGHGENRFWQWMVTWARACRKPSDLGCDDGPFVLPDLIQQQHMVESDWGGQGFLPDQARTRKEQLAEQRRTLTARCEKAAELAPKDRPFVAWCHLNAEADLLEKLIPNAVQVAGSDPDEAKEEKMIGFSNGDIPILVTKPSIAGFGMNWQHCADTSFFPSHSFEQYYQAIRRFLRFGQTKDVNCHIITSERQRRVLDNMLRKERQAEKMFASIVRHMGNELESSKPNGKLERGELPQWL